MAADEETLYGLAGSAQREAIDRGREIVDNSDVRGDIRVQGRMDSSENPIRAKGTKHHEKTLVKRTGLAGASTGNTSLVRSTLTTEHPGTKPESA